MEKLSELAGKNLDQLLHDASPALRAAVDRHQGPARRPLFGSFVSPVWAGSVPRVEGERMFKHN
jgi:hypothetical protein